MGEIILENIRVFSHHGCLNEETLIGSDYRVDLAVTANLKHSSETDELADTVDYVLLNNIVKEEMKLPSKLLEHVGQRILDRIFKESELVETASVKVSKINPPIGGDVQQVTVRLNQSRKSEGK